MSSEDHPTRPVEGSLGPIARVRVDLGVMHLDRDFDYFVPDEWHERAVPGARVRVRFSGRLRWLPAALAGFLRWLLKEEFTFDVGIHPVSGKLPEMSLYRKSNRQPIGVRVF